jgi:hypothetical protein
MKYSRYIYAPPVMLNHRKKVAEADWPNHHDAAVLKGRI